MTFDDNALFRRPNVSELRDYAEEDPREAQAAEHGLNYVALDGEHRLHHQRRRAGDGHHGHDQARRRRAGQLPRRRRRRHARERVATAFRLVLADPKVEAMLVNIFAGINRCDWVAQGVVQAARETQLTSRSWCDSPAPTWMEGRKILKDSGLPIITADTLHRSGGEGGAGLNACEAVHCGGKVLSHEHPHRRHRHRSSSRASPGTRRRSTRRR